MPSLVKVDLHDAVNRELQVIEVFNNRPETDGMPDAI